MHPVREAMNRALKAIAVLKLRQLGFKGSFPHFRRPHERHVDLATFQFNKYGGSFVVEIASLTQEQVASHWSGNLSFSTATAYDASNRHRLGAIGHDDHWFTFGKENDVPGHTELQSETVYASIAQAVAALLASEGERYWAEP